MANIPVRRDDKEYARLLKSNGPNRYKEVKDGELKIFAATASIITGLKPGFGGGMSPDGFVMNGKVLLGRLRIKERVKDDAITV